jgi:hypothetical protein
MDPRLEDLFQQSYRAMREEAPHHENLFYLGDVLDGLPEETYTDLFHVTPAANRLIAERMVELAWGGSAAPARDATSRPRAPAQTALGAKLAAPLD